MTNSWCRIQGIDLPDLARAKGHTQANTYRLLIVALLEQGEPMTLEEVAHRFEEAGIATKEHALASLRRCRPGRSPVYEDEGRYGLDPHDEELDMWVAVLDLKSPDASSGETSVPASEPLPGPEVPLSMDELHEAWSGQFISSWSHKRVVLAMLDAGPGPMPPEAAVALLTSFTVEHSLTVESGRYFGRVRAIDVLRDGRWAITPGSESELRVVRRAVRDKMETVRRYTRPQFDQAAIRAWGEELERRRTAVAGLHRGLVYAFPAEKPEAVALLDMHHGTIDTFIGDEVRGVPARLKPFDLIGGINVRRLLRDLDFEPGDRRLAELGPPQKTKTLENGSTVRVTLELMVTGSCRIRRPFGSAKSLATMLAKGRYDGVRQEVAASAGCLWSLYQYGRLHGFVRLRRGSMDERIPAPWASPSEPHLYTLKDDAFKAGLPLGVIIGAAPTWDAPFAGMELVRVVNEREWGLGLVDQNNQWVDEDDVQVAKLPDSVDGLE